MELEKPQPEQVVTDLGLEMESETPMAARIEDETARENSDENLPPGTIHACYRPGAIDIDKYNAKTRTGSGFQRRKPTHHNVQ
jgi:hypothetical protein